MLIKSLDLDSANAPARNSALNVLLALGHSSRSGYVSPADGGSIPVSGVFSEDVRKWVKIKFLLSLLVRNCRSPQGDQLCMGYHTFVVAFK